MEVICKLYKKKFLSYIISNNNFYKTKAYEKKQKLVLLESTLFFKQRFLFKKDEKYLINKEKKIKKSYTNIVLV